jgi:lipopolysaccharide export system ATP-binding protein
VVVVFIFSMILSTKKISKSFGDRSVLRGIDAFFNKSEIVGILGPNGAGKTTLFSILIGLTKPNFGQIFLDEKDITNLAIHKRSEHGLVYLPQDSSIFRGLSVEDNICAVLEIKNKSKAIILEKLEYLLSAFSVEHLRKVRATALSGGERRKVEIARALAANPKFLLLDEPFSGIDPISVSDIMNIVKQLNNMGIGIIITDHNVRETLTILHRGYIIANGKVLFQGTTAEILNDKNSRELYLGETFKI